MNDSKIDYSQHYRKFHADTPEHIDTMADYYGYMLGSHLPAAKTIRILDIGCGMGYAMIALERSGFTNVSGVEVSSEQADSCRAKNLDVEVTNNTVEYLDRAQGTYDVILALDVVEHIPVTEQLTFVGAIQKALTPGGIFICTVPNASSTLAARWRYIDWTHTSSFTEFSLDFLLYNAGFPSVRVFPIDRRRPLKGVLSPKEYASWLLYRFFRFMRRVEISVEIGRAPAASVPLSLNILAVAQKAR